MPVPAYTRRAVISNLLKGIRCHGYWRTCLERPRASGISEPESAIWRARPDIREHFSSNSACLPCRSAISKNGQFVYDHAGGMADRQHMTQAQQGTLFRIADLSKPITAVTIFSLIEAGKLKPY